MNPIFKYIGNAKYSTKNLEGGYTGKNFLVLKVYLNEKGPSLTIQLLNTFKDHHTVAKSGLTAVGYDEWPLSNALWTKIYNGHSKYRPSEYCQMYLCQLNFAMFQPPSALGISWQFLNQRNVLLCSVYQFHLYIHV